MLKFIVLFFCTSYFGFLYANENTSHLISKQQSDCLNIILALGSSDSNLPQAIKAKVQNISDNLKLSLTGPNQEDLSKAFRPTSSEENLVWVFQNNLGHLTQKINDFISNQSQKKPATTADGALKDLKNDLYEYEKELPRIEKELVKSQQAKQDLSKAKEILAELDTIVNYLDGGFKLEYFYDVMDQAKRKYLLVPEYTDKNWLKYLEMVKILSESTQKNKLTIKTLIKSGFDNDIDNLDAMFFTYTDSNKIERDFIISGVSYNFESEAFKLSVMSSSLSGYPQGGPRTGFEESLALSLKQHNGRFKQFINETIFY